MPCEAAQWGMSIPLTGTENYISGVVNELKRRTKEIKQTEDCLQQNKKCLLDIEERQQKNGGRIEFQMINIPKLITDTTTQLELKRQDLIKYIKCLEERELAKIEQAKLEQKQRELQGRILKRKEQEKQDDLAKLEIVKSMTEKERHIARIKGMDPTEKRKEYAKMCQEREDTKIEYILMYGFEKWEAWERQEKQKVFTGWE
jgi:hypothetical protein